MTKEDLKELVKQHFSLVEIDVEKFDKAMLEDGSEVSNQKSGKFAIGDVLFIKDKEGKFVPAPEGEHVSKSGIQFILDKDSKIVGLKYPDAKGEGSADLKKDEEMAELMNPSDEKKIEKGDQADEGAFASDDKDKMDARTDAEEEGYLDGIRDEKEDLIEAGGFKLEDVVEVIGEVVEAKVEELKDKMKKMDEKMKSIEEKMSAFNSEPAAEKTVPSIKFSAQSEGTSKADKRYNMMLKRLSNK
jgi:hypothetical protein